MSRLTPLVDLASERLGGTVIAANDEFFAPKENLLKPAKPIALPDKYTDRGKWMDGWETRRRRTPGHDWCVVRLGLPGVIRTIIVDTAFFTGNYPSHCSVEASGNTTVTDPESVTWQPLLPQSELRGDAENAFTIDVSRRFTHLRLNIFPDGGVARLRVLGEAVPDWPEVLSQEAAIDLASAVNGAHIVDVSDRFYSEPANMLMPYRALNTGDGWETKRRRGPGHDSVVIRLATEATIARVELDTAHFKGNYPDSTDMEAATVEELAGSVSADLTSTVIARWTPLLPRTPLQADHLHVFESEVTPDTLATHVRLNIYPDGGISRLRIYGVPTREGRRRAALRFFNSLDDRELRRVLADYCGAPAWIEKMAAVAPYENGAAVLAAAYRAADGLSREDWLEAFHHHPRIGERNAERTQSVVAQATSAREQARVAGAGDGAADALAQANREYEHRFGHVFIVSAHGKSADEILSSLRDRLKNEPAREIELAAAEERSIMRRRLETLFA
jgi:allantoicase